MELLSPFYRQDTGVQRGKVIWGDQLALSRFLGHSQDIGPPSAASLSLAVTALQKLFSQTSALLHVCTGEFVLVYSCLLPVGVSHASRALLIIQS